MKKISIVFATMLLMLSMFAVVSAENATLTTYTDNATSVDLPELEPAGAVPGDFFYGFDKFFDNVKLSMTFNPEKKIEKSLNIAEERLAEAEELTKQGKFEKAEKARLQHDKFLGKAEMTFEKFKAGDDINKSEMNLRSISRTEVKFEQHGEKLEEMKAKILERAGENLTDEESAKLENMFQMAEERLAEAEKKANQKKDNFLTNHKLLGNLSDEEAKGFLDKIDSEEGLKEFRKLREARNENRFEEAVKKRESNLDTWKEKLDDENLSQEEVSKIQQKIENEEFKLEDFKNGFEIKSKLQETLDECRKTSHEKILECQGLEENEMKSCLESSREESQKCLEGAKEIFKSESDFNISKDSGNLSECQNEIREKVLKCQELEESKQQECLLDLRKESQECTLDLNPGFNDRMNDIKGEFKKRSNIGEHEKEFDFENKRPELKDN